MEEAKIFLSQYEPELAITTEPAKRYYLLFNLTPAALAANETEKAQKFAQEILDLGDKLKSQPGFGPGLLSDAAHIGNIVLGHLAMRANNVDLAKAHLLAAGEVSGSALLNSFGPSMLLAKQLLEKDETEAVIKYLKSCAKFWQSDKGRLEKWKATIERGEIPEFDNQLRVRLESWRFAK